MRASSPPAFAAALIALFALNACATAPTPVAPRAVPSLPVILVHGFAGQGESLGDYYFVDVPPTYAALGVKVFSANLSPYGDSTLRSGQLAAFTDKVLAETGAAKVHIVAHSQGGIDTRYMIHTRGYADRIASLTTLSTPHRGTAVADLSQYFPDVLIDVTFYPFGWFARVDDTLPIEPAAAMRQLRPETMAAFNAAHPGTGGVPTFSVATVTNANSQQDCDGGARLPAAERSATTWWLLPTHLYLRSVVEAGPNDGLVTAKSARWEHFLGCIGADHVAVVGVGAQPIGAAESTEFQPVPFFIDHLSLLADVERGAYVTAAP